MQHELMTALLAQGVEIRVLPGLDRTVWRPAIRVLKLAGRLSKSEMTRDMRLVLESVCRDGVTVNPDGAGTNE